MNVLYDECIIPVIYPPSKLPVSLLEHVKQTLFEMEMDGIIVEENEHTL